LGGLAAFLRMGEIEMRKLKLVPYSKEGFKEILKEIRAMVRTHPEDFALKLQQFCSSVGVAIIFTATIPKAPISGVARWVGGTPLIQLTDRYKSNDQFWFSFFHEAGHILLHGKKDVFVEDLKEYELNAQKEIEANNFSNKWLLPENIMSELPDNITEKDIRQLARKYNTHTAIVLGRLQRLKILPYSFGNKLKLKVVLDKYINRNLN
jgi:HTH-type transcriptional regulator/antitoxin HigA